MSNKNTPPNDRLSAEFSESASLDALIERTSAFLREKGLSVEGVDLEQALRESPLGEALLQTREMLSRAEHQNLTDALTGIRNRAGFIKSLHEQITTLQENPDDLRESMAVVFIDLDGFKQVNDKCGHACGDDALVKVADRFRHQFAPVDGIVGRLGGDEMVLFLPSDMGVPADQVEAKIRADVDEALDGLVYWNDGTPYPIGASLGVHVFNPQEMDEAGESVRDQIHDILEQADIKMYQDKWGAYDPESGLDPLSAPKNQRLHDLCERYIRERAASSTPSFDVPGNNL